MSEHRLEFRLDWSEGKKFLDDLFRGNTTCYFKSVPLWNYGELFVIAEEFGEIVAV